MTKKLLGVSLSSISQNRRNILNQWSHFLWAYSNGEPLVYPESLNETHVTQRTN